MVSYARLRRRTHSSRKRRSARPSWLACCPAHRRTSAVALDARHCAGDAVSVSAQRRLSYASVYKMRCHVRHAARGARGTEGSAFAREGHHHRVSTALATQMHEAVFENAATKILIELACDEARKGTLFFGEFGECGPVFVNDSIEKRLFGTTALGHPHEPCVGRKRRRTRSCRLLNASSARWFVRIMETRTVARADCGKWLHDRPRRQSVRGCTCRRKSGRWRRESARQILHRRSRRDNRFREGGST